MNRSRCYAVAYHKDDGTVGRIRYWSRISDPSLVRLEFEADVGLKPVQVTDAQTGESFWRQNA